MAREDLALIMQGLNGVREMMTIDVDNLLTVLEVAIRNHPVVSTHGLYLQLYFVPYPLGTGAYPT